MVFGEKTKKFVLFFNENQKEFALVLNKINPYGKIKIL